MSKYPASIPWPGRQLSRSAHFRPCPASELVSFSEKQPASPPAGDRSPGSSARQACAHPAADGPRCPIPPHVRKRRPACGRPRDRHPPAGNPAQTPHSLVNPRRLSSSTHPPRSGICKAEKRSGVGIFKTFSVLTAKSDRDSRPPKSRTGDFFSCPDSLKQTSRPSAALSHGRLFPMSRA